MFKDNKNVEQAAENVLRSYLLRCFFEVAQQYPAIKLMPLEEGVEELLKLKRENKIKIELMTVNDKIDCTIRYVQ